MLSALNAAGELQSLYQMTKQQIFAAKKRTYYCPVCHEPLHIRSGIKVIPHFAHFPKSECSALKRGESLEHEEGNGPYINGSINNTPMFLSNITWKVSNKGLMCFSLIPVKKLLLNINALLFPSKR